jgi:hypothetical protein
MSQFSTKISIYLFGWIVFVNIFTYVYTMACSSAQFSAKFFRDLCLLGGSLGGFLGRLHNYENIGSVRIFRIRDLAITGLSNFGLLTLVSMSFKRSLITPK